MEDNTNMRLLHDQILILLHTLLRSCVGDQTHGRFTVVVERVGRMGTLRVRCEAGLYATETVLLYDEVKALNGTPHVRAIDAG